MTDEEYVRSKWDWVQVRLAEPFEGIAEGKWTARLPLLPFSQVAFTTEAEAWGALDAYTRTRKRQIADIEEEEIAAHCLIADYRSRGLRSDVPERIFGRIESIKAELQRGMLAEPRKHEGEVKP